MKKNFLLISLLIFLFPSLLIAQQRQVKGTILDETGAPVGDATVTVKGSTTGTKTDASGNFTLTIPPGINNPELVLSHVNYFEKTVPVSGAELSVSLQKRTAQLDEVVVVGYGTQKRKDITGAVALFKPDNLDERPIPRVDQALVGQMAGVQVKQTSGVPGKGFSIRIRGTGSITANTEPLYVIDGFALESVAQNAGGGFSTGNPLDNLNPSDIESIQVMKDASASAIYGSRAANGVVIITTKKGKSGKAKISAGSYVGFNETAKKVDMLSGQEWVDRAIEMINYTWVNSGAGRTAAQTTEQRRVILGLPVGGVDVTRMIDDRWLLPGHPGLTYVNWQDEFFRRGLVQDYQLSASGGSEYVKYYVSGDYFNQDGIAIGVDYKRYTGRANIEIIPNNKFKFGLNVSPSFSVINDPGVDQKDALMHLAASVTPVVESAAGLEQGTKRFGPYRWGVGRVSPVAQARETIGQTRNLRTLATVYGQANILKSLALNSSVNFDNGDATVKNFKPANVQEGAQVSTGSYTGYNRQNFATEHTLTYDRLFGDKHHVNVLAGYSYSTFKYNNYTINGGVFTNNDITVINGAFNTGTSGSTGETKNVLISYFGRAQYSFEDRYLVNASLRRDGSSRFGSKTQWGIFPSASVGWRISEEKFMKSVQLISDLKLRASWGITGNNGIPDYADIATLSGANTSFGGVLSPGQIPGNYSNSLLGWEESKTTNLGLDGAVLNNRISFSLDYYIKDNSDLLLQIPISGVTGFTSALVNIGAVRNKGWEVELNSRNLMGTLKWNTSLNLSHNSNVVKKLGPNNTPIENNGGFNEGHRLMRVGQPMNVLFLVQQNGLLSAQDISSGYPLFPNEEAGDPKYIDANKDGKIDANDRVLSGDPAPDLTWGITNTLNYKGFDLTVFVQGQNGGLAYAMIGRALQRTGQGYMDNLLGVYRNRWRSAADPGDGIHHKAPQRMGFIKNTDWLYSSDYWRVRNITLGYNLSNLVRVKSVSSARLYITAENWFGGDKYDGGWNPEAVNTNGDDYGGFPLSKGFIVGLNINF